MFKIMIMNALHKFVRNLVNLIMMKSQIMVVCLLFGGIWSSLKITLGTRENGKFIISDCLGLMERTSVRVKDARSGLMVLCMRVGGETIKLTVVEGLFMLMVISMMDIGLMIKLMELVFISILMELSMKANGKRINNTETV